MQLVDMNAVKQREKKNCKDEKKRQKKNNDFRVYARYNLDYCTVAHLLPKYDC